MKSIKPKIEDDGKVFKEVYESTPIAYSVDEGGGESLAIGVDDSVVPHSPVGEVNSEPSTYTVITERSARGGIDYNPDDDDGFYIPGQDPITKPGSSNSNMDYSSPSSLLVLKNTGSSVRSGGRGISSKTAEGNKSHVVDRNNDYITRDIKNTKANNVSLSERVTVVPGTVSTGSSFRQVSTGYGWALTAGNKYNKPLTWDIISSFEWGGGDVTIDYRYASYVRVSGQNFARGKLAITLAVAVPGGYEPVETLKSWNTNVGYRKSESSLNTHFLDGSKSGSTTVPNLKRGKYYVVIEMRDTYQDTDFDKNGYPFYGWASTVVKQVTNNSGVDNSYATVELIDLATATVLNKYMVCTSGGTENVSFSVPGNKSYRIRYTLHRGNGKTGGLYGTGATMYVHNGNVTQDWKEYTYDDPKEEFPYVPPGNYEPPFTGDVEEGGSNGGVEVPAPSIYCWLDVFRLYSAKVVEPEPDCFGNDVTVKITEGGSRVDKHVFDDSDRFIEFSLENTSTTPKTYDITFDYDHDCDGDPPIHLYGGKFTFEETREPDESAVSINGFYAEQEKDVWYGAEGSKLQFNVYDNQGNLIKTYTWDTAGEHRFDVTNLGYLPYSNYRAEFITTQRGEVSPVTNIDYRAEFFIDDFRAHELWKPTPLPFNSILEFYIDDVLVGRWDTEGGGVFKHNVPKGKHTYKWVFINSNLENTWDFAEIDWFRLTNWICDAIIITPYCEPGRGDEAVEALLKCLLEVWKQRPEGCVFGNKKIWLFT